MINFKHSIFFMDVAHVSLEYLVPFLKKSMERRLNKMFYQCKIYTHVHVDWSE